ncbi:MAG: cell division protein FtsA [Thermodesulfovibrionales bacterium]|nr:cell division protein FtsA [Thermodesulfovibrionales bacterium]
MLKKRQPDNLIVGLDTGSTKTCAVAVVINESTPEVIAYSIKPTKGIKKGVLIDIEGLSKTISSTIEDIEEKIDIPISNVFMSVPATHVKFINSSAIVSLKKNEVTENDISSAIANASSIKIDSFLEKIHVIPYEYVIDNTPGILKPIGMSGYKLEAKVNIVAYDSNVLQNFVKCCHIADIDVETILLQSLGSYESVLFEDEREKGLLFIDIGGGKTEISIFRDGFMRGIQYLPIGGNHFTNDLSICLKIPFNEAERIKKTYDSNPMINIEALTLEGQIKNISIEEIESIIYPRMEETFVLIRDMISSWRFDEPILSGVITGGASQLNGIVKIAEDILQLPVRRGIVNLNKENNCLNKVITSFDLQELRKPEYAAAIGAVNYGTEKYLSENYGSLSQKTKRFFKKVKRFFKKKS